MSAQEHSMTQEGSSIDLDVASIDESTSALEPVANSSCSGACCGGPSCNSAPNP